MDADAKLIELQATDVYFFSQGDEDAFFAWLSRLAFVESYAGRGSTLYIRANLGSVDHQELREIIALFHRYGIDLRQLAAFDRPEFATWFRDKRSYWYEGIFG